MSKANLEVRVRRLEPRDDRTGFRSGNIDLDRFFQRYAGQNQFRHHIGTTYVVDAKQDAISFYSSLGFKPIDLISGALGDRPEPSLCFCPLARSLLPQKKKRTEEKQTSIFEYAGSNDCVG